MDVTHGSFQGFETPILKFGDDLDGLSEGLLMAASLKQRVFLAERIDTYTSATTL